MEESQRQNAVWIADSGLFIACGRQQNGKYIALARFATTNGITFLIPQRIHNELGGAPEISTPGQTPVNSAIDAGWVAVADRIDYTTPAVATVMDDVRRYNSAVSIDPVTEFVTILRATLSSDVTERSRSDLTVDRYRHVSHFIMHRLHTILLYLRDEPSV
ncbi:hypothetical protein [Halocatena pleomorpha]|uniref:hypothetical protein n=1 Tax=Halocatena pleomorpha TaxID=1785090 RepID=UPI001C8AF4EF|nr:hypothetical protein [Halocatena pleomorpha]